MAKTPKAAPDAVLVEEPEDRYIELIAVQTMAGDVRDFILDRMKHDHSPLPWNMRNEEEQRRYIDQTTLAANNVVRRIVQLVATQDRPFIGAHIKKAEMKDVIAVELHVGLTHPLRHELLDSVGHEVLIVLSGVEEFMGERSAPVVNKDQAAMFGDDEPDKEDA
jgi:hypothetical protein